MKHDVHIFALVRVKCAGIEAESHDEAAKKAMERFHDLYDLFETGNCRRLPDGMTEVEFGEEFSHSLVDETDDPEHERSTWHNAKGDDEPMIDTDTTEELRRVRLAVLNAEPSDRQALEQRHGQVWDGPQLGRDFEVMGFMAPLVVARRKSDGMRGSLEFQHHPRFYFNWEDDTP